MRKPTLKHTQIIRLSCILNMMYKPSEIAEEIDVTADTTYRSYQPAGLAHIRDDQGNVWIHGPAFVSWAKETVCKRKSQRAGLPADHAWCMKCNGPVQMKSPRLKAVNRYIEILQATCPHCQRTVNRARARGGLQ